MAAAGRRLPERRTIEVKARGEKIRVLVNGHLAATPRSGEVTALPLDSNVCSVIRAEIDGGFGGPIYANCAFAAARPGW